MKPIDILTNGQHSKNISQGICNYCKKEFNVDTEFKDEVSRREYKISGFCQKCQDDIFKC